MARLCASSHGNEDNERAAAHQEFPGDWDPDAVGFDRAAGVIVLLTIFARLGNEGG